jgi:hypothetical protein
VRFLSSLLLILCLAACQHGGKNNTDEVRQGVIDHLAKANYNVAGMDIKIAAVQFNGDQADATVAVTAKGQNGAAPMNIPYHLERQNNKWVVVGTPNASGHAGGAAPVGGGGGAEPGAGGANPHGGGGGKMPSPDDLPPSKK